MLIFNPIFRPCKSANGQDVCYHVDEFAEKCNGSDTGKVIPMPVMERKLIKVFENVPKIDLRENKVCPEDLT